jgi:hypothetical protein
MFASKSIRLEHPRHPLRKVVKIKARLDIREQLFHNVLSQNWDCAKNSRFIKMTILLLCNPGMIEILLTNNCSKFSPDCPDLVFAGSGLVFETGQGRRCLDELLGATE